MINHTPTRNDTWQDKNQIIVQLWKQCVFFFGRTQRKFVIACHFYNQHHLIFFSTRVLIGTCRGSSGHAVWNVQVGHKSYGTHQGAAAQRINVRLPSWSLTWNLKMAPWNRWFLLEIILFKFHVKLGECILWLTPWKINMEPKKGGSLQMIFLFN